MACWEASQRPREPSLLLGKPGLPILRSGGASKVSRQSSESQDVHTEYLSQSNPSLGWLRSAVNVHRQVHQQECSHNQQASFSENNILEVIIMSNDENQA